MVILNHLKSIKKIVMLVVKCFSVRSPEENRWIIDPVLIADAYGPEVPVFSKTHKSMFALIIVLLLLLLLLIMIIAGS